MTHMQQGQAMESGGNRTLIEGVPDEREYESDELQELDHALVRAIAKAEAADYPYLASLLRHELGSLYFGSK